MIPPEGEAHAQLKKRGSLPETSSTACLRKGPQLLSALSPMELLLSERCSIRGQRKG